jgi:hypothetical protein
MAMTGKWVRRGSAIVLDDVDDLGPDEPDEFLGRLREWLGVKPDAPAAAKRDAPATVPTAPAPAPASTSGGPYRPVWTRLEMATRRLEAAQRERRQAGSELRAATAALAKKQAALAAAEAQPPSPGQVGARTMAEWGQLIRLHLAALQRAVSAAAEAKRVAEGRWRGMVERHEAAKREYQAAKQAQRT